jgi:hypothetical protein
VGEKYHPRQGEVLQARESACFAWYGVTLHRIGKALWVFTEAKGEYCGTVF